MPKGTARKRRKNIHGRLFRFKAKDRSYGKRCLGRGKTIALSRPDSFSLYVAIPFCPSRCSYCSFVSHSTETESAKKTIPEYVKLLCEELRITGKIAKEAKLRLESVYFGGGTPTSLSAAQLTMLFDAVRENFDLSTCREYTVEAGRPDTITEEKLLAIKNGGAGRISINPQTFSDEVLKISAGVILQILRGRNSLRRAQ